jgi:hypothetical protein
MILEAFGVYETDTDVFALHEMSLYAEAATPKTMLTYEYPLIDTREHRCRRTTHRRRLEVVLLADRERHHTDPYFPSLFLLW